MNSKIYTLSGNLDINLDQVSRYWCLKKSQSMPIVAASKVVEENGKIILNYLTEIFNEK